MIFIQLWQLFALSSSHQHQSKKMSLIDTEKENNKRDQQSNIKTQENLVCTVLKIYILNINKNLKHFPRPPCINLVPLKAGHQMCEPGSLYLFHLQ